MITELFQLVGRLPSLSDLWKMTVRGYERTAEQDFSNWGWMQSRLTAVEGSIAFSKASTCPGWMVMLVRRPAECWKGAGFGRLCLV